MYVQCGIIKVQIERGTVTMKKTEIINIRVSAETKRSIEEMANEYGMTTTEYLMMCFSSKIWELQADETEPSMTLERAKKLTLNI